MGIIQKIRRGLASLVGARIKEDIAGGLTDFVDEPDHKNYRPLGRGNFRAAIRDLTPQSQVEQSKQAFKFFVENPFIRRLAKMTAEFIVGNGISVKSKNPAVQGELDAWWNDPVNDMEQRHFTLAIELPLYGEIILERVMNAFTGRHRYSPLDPLFASSVLPHQKYQTIPAAIEFYGAIGENSRVIAQILNGVPEQEQLAMKPSTDLTPFVFFFRTNGLSGSLRGHSNFYPLFEWADVLDNAAFTMAERMVILLTYVWHLQSDNLSEDQKKQYREKLEQANPGSALITGNNVKFTAVTPDLKAADFTEGARFLKNLVAGSAGVPEHWMGEGGDVNRATATAMNLPTLRSFLQLQREYVRLLRTLARANLVSVASRGRIPMSEVDNFTIQVDPMSEVDIKMQAEALKSLVDAISAAKLEGWLTDEEARQLIRHIAGGIAELDESAPAPTQADQMSDREKKAAAGMAALFKKSAGA